MIDVHHPDAAELGDHAGSQRFPRAKNDSQSGEPNEESNEGEDEEEDEEEAAWLQSVQEDNLTDVHGMQTGGLVMDVNQLRGEQSAAKKSLKANAGS